MKPQLTMLFGALTLGVAACGGSVGQDAHGPGADPIAPTSVAPPGPADPEGPTSVAPREIAAPTTTAAPTTPTTPTPTTETQPTSTPTPTTAPTPTNELAGLGDSFYEFMGNGGYDVIHYDVGLEIDPTANTIRARTTITARATQDLPTFNLDLSGLKVDSVEVDGESADFSRQFSELVVSPSDHLAAGATFFATVRYSGMPEPINDPGVPFVRVGWHQRDDVIYTVNEPSGAMSWFPSNNHPTDKATFEFQLTVPDPYTAAATGVLVDEIRRGGATTTTWRMDQPMATYLAAIYVGDFERHETELANGLLIRDYIPRARPAGVVGALAVTPEAIRYFENLLGPYPFDVYGTIVMPFGLGFALENQTLSVHGRYAIDPLTVSHEIIHQWLGNSSTLADWSDIWLHEGFATYLSHMYMAEHHGWDIDEAMAGQHETMVATDAVPPLEITVSELFSASVYSRGALALHALRQLVGDAAFREIVRTHYERSAHGSTSTAEFLDLVALIADEEAARLVEAWLRQDPIPVL